MNNNKIITFFGKIIRNFLVAAVIFSNFAVGSLSAQTYNLRIKIIDELGTPLDSPSPPYISLENCAAPRVEATRLLGNGVYELAVTTGIEDRTCSLRITSPQYLFTGTLSTDDLGVYQDKTSSPITLYYRTRVIVRDAAGSPITDAVVHHIGFSPQRAAAGVYYFTTNGAGPLLVERSGFVTENGSINTKLRSVSGGTDNAATVVELSGQTACSASESVAAGTQVVCARLMPTLNVTVRNAEGEILGDATVRIFSDLARTALGNDGINPGEADAQKTTNAFGKATFALPDGRYYARAEKLGYNDANTVIDVQSRIEKNESIVLARAGANVISPGRSQVSPLVAAAPADSVTPVIFTIKIFDGNAEPLGRRSVTIISNRVEDTLAPLEAITNASGTVVFAATSSKAGESVFTVIAESTTLSTFPKITFTLSAAALSSTVPSVAESKVEASVSPITSKGDANITVTIKNDGGVPLSGKLVRLISSRPQDDIFTPASAATNQEGKAVFSVRSNTAGTSVISVQTEGITLKEMAVITFSPAARYFAGDLIKSADNPAVYYYGADGSRHAFPNEKIYKTWYDDFSKVKIIDAQDLTAIPLGKNVPYRPGVRMVKLQTAPKVYAVSRGGVLRWVQTEEVARTLYGADWNKNIDDLSDAFFVDYHEGISIPQPADYSPSAETANAPTIDEAL